MDLDAGFSLFLVKQVVPHVQLSIVMAAVWASMSLI